METPYREPMKQRFKKPHLWKLPHEVRFDDDVTEFATCGLKLMRRINRKPHSHAGGRKPIWRAIRKTQRKFHCKEV